MLKDRFYRISIIDFKIRRDHYLHCEKILVSHRVHKEHRGDVLWIVKKSSGSEVTLVPVRIRQGRKKHRLRCSLNGGDFGEGDTECSTSKKDSFFRQYNIISIQFQLAKDNIFLKQLNHFPFVFIKLTIINEFFML